MYGSTTVSDTLGEGTTLKELIILSGYSSFILLINRVPIPEQFPDVSMYFKVQLLFTFNGYYLMHTVSPCATRCNDELLDAEFLPSVARCC